MNCYVPLLEARRDGIAERVVYGAVAWATGSTLVHVSGGDPVLYGRSCLKPVMMRVFASALGDVTTGEQKAIACSSHDGTTEHVQIARSLLPKDRWPLLKTPVSVPFGPLERAAPGAPSRWHHCCSGQHAAILKGCVALGWDEETYQAPTHPSFQAMLDEVRVLAGRAWTPRNVVPDNCGLPTVAMTLGELAQMFAGLARHRADNWIWEAMTAHPRFVGGDDRADTRLMELGGGRVLAKEGADGLLGLGVVSPRFPAGLGVVIKLSHGFNTTDAFHIAHAVLGQAGVELGALKDTTEASAHEVVVSPEVSP